MHEIRTSVHAPAACRDICRRKVPDFERLERLATKHNVGNATLGRQIIREYLKRKAKKD